MAVLKSLESSSRSATFFSSQPGVEKLEESLDGLQISSAVTRLESSSLQGRVSTLVGNEEQFAASELSILEKLPKELLLLVFSFASVEDLRRTSLTCRFLKARSNEGFYLLCEKVFMQSMFSLFNVGMDLNLVEVRKHAPAGIHQKNVAIYKELLVGRFLDSQPEGAILRKQGISWDQVVCSIMSWPKLSEAQRGHLAFSFIGRPRAVENLLANGSISVKDREQMARIAAWKRHTKSLKLVLGSGEISEDAHYEICVIAAELASVEELRVLLNKKLLSEGNRGKLAVAVIESIRDFKYERERIEALKVILENGLIPEFSFNKLCQLSVQRGLVQILKELLALKGQLLSDSCRGILAYKAADQDRLDLLDALLESGPLCKASSGLVIRAVAANGHVNKLKELVGRFAEENLWEEAAIGAAEKGQLQVLELTLADRDMSQEYVDVVAYRAAINGHLKALQLALTKGQMSKSYIESAVKEASKSGHEQITEFLRKLEN